MENMAGNIISESVTNTKTIFAYNMEEKVVNMYVNVLSGKDKSVFKRSIVIGALFGASQFILFATYATLFYAGGNFMAQHTLELRNMLKSIFCIFFAAFGIGHAQQYLGDLSEAQKALISLFKLFDEPSLIDPFEKKIVPKDISGKIEFRNVVFSYPTRPSQVILNGLSFTIYPGQRAAFIGYSGSGKSTIVQLLERFYDVQSGEILIDDLNIKNYDLIMLRKLISLVMQEPVLFKKDIIENIKYGKLDATKEEIVKAATEAKILKFIQPEYDKNILPVSGGEKQRIAIARAIIKQPRILLLDEATSALDKLVEEDIQKSLEEIMQNKTSIVVAHR
jgi:ATP-binding cassette subfamily B (MDR/TAP) protein 1